MRLPARLVLLAVLPGAAATALLLGTAASAQDGGPIWSSDDALYVTEARFGNGDDPDGSITFAWDAPDAGASVEEFELLRDGETIGVTVDGAQTSITDPSPSTDGEPHAYSLVATYDGGETTDPLGSPAVRLKDDEAGCTILWTAAEDRTWEDPRNWAPYGAPGDVLGTSRMPGAADLACINHYYSENIFAPVSYIVLSAPDPIDGLLVTASPGNGVGDRLGLDLAGGDLKVANLFQVRSLRLSGGSLTLSGNGTVGDGEKDGNVRLAGGEITVPGTLEIVNDAFGGVVEVDGGTTTLSGGGTVLAGEMDVTAASSNLVGNGITVEADAVSFERADGVLSVGAGGATLRTDRVTVGSSDGGDVGWTIEELTPTEDLYLSASSGGTLVVDDLADVDAANGDTATGAELNVFGTIDLREDITTFDSGRVVVGGSGQVLTSKLASPWESVTAVRDFTVRNGGTVSFNDDLTIDSLRMSGGFVTLGGTLVEGFDAGTKLQLEFGSILTVGEKLVIGKDWRFSMIEDSKIIGPIDNQGDLGLGRVPTDELDVVTEGGQLEITDTLDLDPLEDGDGIFRLVIVGSYIDGTFELYEFSDIDGDTNDDGSGDVDVKFGGTLIVRVEFAAFDENFDEKPLPEEIEKLVLSFARFIPQGVFDQILVEDVIFDDLTGDEADGGRFEVEVREDGIYIVRGDGGGDDPPAWGAGDALSVTEARVAADGSTASVLLAWPAPANAAQVTGYEILRDGAGYANLAPGTTTFLDEAAVNDGVAHTYTVAATHSGGTIGPLGAPAVRFVPLGEECTIVWTGAVDGSWEDARNWAPYGEDKGASVGAPRVPNEDDTACVTHDEQLRGGVTVTAPPSGVASVIVAGPENGRDSIELTFAGGDLEITNGLRAEALVVREGGELTLKAGGEVVTHMDDGEQPELLLSGGRLEIQGNLDLDSSGLGRVEIVSNQGTVLAGAGQLTTARVIVPAGEEVSLRAQDETTLRADDLLVGDVNTPARALFDEGGTGGRLIVETIRVLGDETGTLDLDWVATAPLGAVLSVVSDGPSIRITDLAGVTGADTTAEIDLSTSGNVSLTEEVTQLDGVVTIAGDGALRVDASPTSFDGISAVRDLRVIDGATVNGDREIGFGVLTVGGGAKVVLENGIGDAFGPGTTINLRDQGEIELLEELVLADDVAVTVQGEAQFRGDIDNAGTIQVFGGAPQVLGDLRVIGDLTQQATGVLSMVVDGPAIGARSDLDVTGTLLAAGRLTVSTELATDPDGEFDLRFVSAGTASGTFAPIQLTGTNAAEYKAEVRADGVHLVAAPKVGDGSCSQTIEPIRGLTVFGCWTRDAAGVYRTSVDIAAQIPLTLPGIGGVTFAPQGTTELILDIPNQRLHSRIAGGSPGTGQLEIQIPILGGGNRRVDGESIGAVFGGIDWNLDDVQGALFDIADFLGLDADVIPRLRIDEAAGQWVLDVTAKLPAVFEQLGVDFDIPFGDQGIQVAAIAAGGLAVVLGEVAEAAGVDLNYLGDRAWGIANDVQEGLGIDGSFAYEGDLDRGSLEVTNLEFAGLGPIDVTLTVESLAGNLKKWSGTFGSKNDLVVEFLTEGDALVAGKVALNDVEIGLATLREVEVVRQRMDVWEFSADVETLDAEAAASGSVIFREGDVLAAQLNLVGDFGPLGTFDPLTFTYTGTLREDDYEGRFVGLSGYTLTGTISSGGEDSSFNGLAVLDASGLRFGQLDADLALGELARIEARMTLDASTGTWTLGEQGGGDGPAVLTCQGGQTPIEGSLTLAGGLPTQGRLFAQGLCFGIERLEQLDMRLTTTDPEEPGVTFTVQALLTRAEGGTSQINGSLRMLDGHIEEGFLELPELSIGGLVEIPASTVTASRAGQNLTWQWRNQARADGAAFDVSLTFRNGSLRDSSILLGTLSAPTAMTPSIATAGEWLDLTGFRLVYNRTTGLHTVAGRLRQPATQFEGLAAFEASGSLELLTFEVRDLAIGSLALLDLDVDFVSGTTFALDATLTGGDQGGTTGSGELRFNGSTLTDGFLSIEALPIGELGTIDDFAFVYDDGGLWAAAGTWTGNGAEESVAIAGGLTFDDGVLTSASLELQNLVIGPAVVEDFTLDLVRTATSGVRQGTYALSALVRSPVTDRDEAELEPITGSMTLVDGVVTNFALSVPFLEFGGLLYVEDLDLTYAKVDGVATISGSGSVTTAAGTGTTAATFTSQVQDGRVLAASIGASSLALGGPIRIDDFLASYDSKGELLDCPGLGDAGTARIYQLSGQVGDTSAAGCLGLDTDGNLVGFDLSLGDLRIGELGTIESANVTFVSTEVTEVLVSDDEGAVSQFEIPVGRTSLSLDGRWVSGALAPTDVTGSVVLRDGGLESLDVTVSRIDLSETVRFEDLALSYENSGRFSDTGVTSLVVLGDAVHGGGRTTVAGALEFGAGAAPAQRLTGASLAVIDLDFGPATIDELIFEYASVSTSSSWTLAGSLTAGGKVVAVDGTATIGDGRLQEATLALGGITIGELFTIDAIDFEFRREAGLERWAGGGTVTGSGGDTTSASGSLTFSEGGRLEDASFNVAGVSWGGLFTIQDLSLEFVRNGNIVRWDVAGALLLDDGTTSSLTGQLILDDSVVISGTLGLRNVRIGELFVIDTLDLTATRAANQTNWDAALVLSTDKGRVDTAGSMRWVDGRLQEATLSLNEARLGDLLTLRDVTLRYEELTSWAFGGSVVHEDGVSTLGGSVGFTNGRLSSGALTAANIKIGPLQLNSFKLGIQSQVDTGTAVQDIGNVCGVGDRATGGTRFAVEAVVGTGDGGTTEMGGRFRVQNRALTEGVLCAADLQITDFVVLDTATLEYSRVTAPDGNRSRFAGAARVSNVDRGTTSAGSFEFEIKDRVLQAAEVTATNLKLGELLDFRTLELDYDRGQNGGQWVVSATVNRPGQGSGTLGGALDVEDGVITGGALLVDSLPFGDAFVLNTLSIEFRGRRGAANPPPSTPTGGFNTTNNGCSANPTSLAQLSTDNGAESAYAVAASVTTNGATYAAGGSLSFANGRLQSFDVIVACAPIGSFATVSDLRVQWTRDQVFRFTGRLVRGDGSNGPRGSVAGEFVFNNGRLSGGSFLLQDVPIGAVVLEELSLSLGQNANGTSTWGLGVVIKNSNNNTVGGSGSLTIRDGTIVGGSFTLPEIPIVDVFVVRNVTLTFDSTQPGFTRLAGSGSVKKGTGGEASLAFDVTYRRGQGLWAASFSASQAALFEVVPVGQLSIAFDRGLNTWSGDISIGFGGGGDRRRTLDLVERSGGLSARNTFGQASLQPGSFNTISFGPPGFRLGFEITDGRLTSGIFGFDANGDGTVDEPDENGNLPASGAGDFANLPLKALYIKYCSDSAAANPFVTFCAPIDADTWSGRVAIEFPTDAAPSLDASLVLRNGRFASASLDVGFGTPGVPLFPGVFLRSLGASLQVDPRLAFEGRLGVNLLEIADVEANFGFSEEPDPALTGLPADEYEAEYLKFYLQARVQLFGLPIRANAFVEVQTRGYLAMGGGVDVVLVRRALGVNNFLVVRGGVEGSVFDGPALGAINPRTGNPITGASFQVRGFVEGKVAGVTVASAEFVVNPIGGLGCIGTFLGETGAGIRWSGGFSLGCDTEDYVIEGVDSEFGNFARNSDGSVATARRVEDEVVTFEVAEGEEFLGLVINGADGEQPMVDLVAPDGSRLAGVEDSVLEDDGVLINSVEGAHLFQIFQPQAGTWTVEPQAGFAPVDTMQVFQNLEPAQITGDIEAIDGGRMALAWTAVLDGQKQRVEVQERVDGVTSASLGVLNGGSGRIEFGPSGPGEAGTRELVAVVTNDGMPGTEFSLGTYEVAEASFATAPQNVQVTEVSGGARVSWERPADNGGRRITSYKIFSNAGFSTVVDPDVFETTIEIPGMTVGEEVPVAVEAFTIAGWGVRGVGVFTSTQETALQYLTPGASGTRVELARFPTGVVTRLAGETRVETAVEVSRATFEPGVDTVWLATANNFPDALAAGPAAVQRGGPILLATDELPAVTAAEIARLKPGRVVVMGGPAAVPVAVVAELEGLVNEVVRYGGADRFETAALTSAATFEPGVEVAYIATGRNFPDALAGGVAAGAEGGPVLLTERNALPATTAAELRRLAPERVVVLGGQVAVSNGALLDITQALPGVRLEVVAGADRYDTAAQIGEDVFPDAEEVWVATGRNFPDALAGVPAAVAAGAPLLLVGDDVPEATARVIDVLAAQRATVLGGEVAVPPTVAASLAARLGVG